MTKTRLVDASSPGIIEEAARIIRRGGLVAFPTETVYGLGADGCNPEAVARIFEVKRRPSFDPLILHVGDPESAGRYGIFPDKYAPELMARFWPGPLTLVVPKTALVPPIVTAGLETVAIRVPAHPASLALMWAVGGAIAAPSANLFGYVSPTEARHVAEQLSGSVDLIIDGGPCPVGIESTIVALTGSTIRILRAGGITPEELGEIVGNIDCSAGAEGRPDAPGQLARHYATRTPLDILPEGRVMPAARPGERVGLLALSPPPHREGFAAVEVLSQDGNLREAAANLFSALRRLDSLMLDRLLASPVPEKGLGIAIMDRLRRCSAGRDILPVS